MKASSAHFLQFIRKSPQFVIPIYQRSYSWTERECKQLWDDIIRTGQNDDISAHFIGSIVYIEKGLYHITNQSPLLVIDGQQRLTTITLFLAALAGILEKQPVDKQEPEDGFSPRKLWHYYLVNREEKDELYYKLLLSETDRESLISIVSKSERPSEHSIRIYENYQFFRKSIIDFGDLSTICKGIAKLIIVDISLSRDQDNPQLIFESMNSTGRELTQADLIRNYILMGLEPKLQTDLYKRYWRPMEKEFGQEAYGTDFDRYMRHFLTVKTGDIPRVGDVYEAFKTFSRTPDQAALGVEALVAEIRKYSGYYCAMALGKERDRDLHASFQDLRELKVDVAFPLLLELYDDYANGKLQKEEFLEIVKLIESYVFRRAVCSIPTNSMNKTFATFSKMIKKDRYRESVEASFLLLPSYRRFPNDEEFTKELKVRDLYNFPRRSLLLRKLENFGRKEYVNIEEYTIEHIMPQNRNLSKSWQDSLGGKWESIHKTLLHTLGNLTLTGYNSEYSDKPFDEKRDMPGGFRESPLRLNADLKNLQNWSEENIKARAERMSETALNVWYMPQLDADTIEQYRPKTSIKTSYNLEDHQHLIDGISRLLFDAFRREVLALDPVVHEEILKLYIAFKAETNFADVIPLKNRLRITLNLKFHEIIDPKGICRDVKGLGRWGNGEVEVTFSSLEELPYLMSLVRQAFEKQMGNGDDE